MSKKISPLHIFTPAPGPKRVVSPLHIFEATPGDLYFALSSSLANDDNSSNDELIADYTANLGLTPTQAKEIVARRIDFERVDLSSPDGGYNAGCQILKKAGIKNRKLI